MSRSSIAMLTGACLMNAWSWACDFRRLTSRGGSPMTAPFTPAKLGRWRAVAEPSGKGRCAVPGWERTVRGSVADHAALLKVGDGVADRLVDGTERGAQLDGGPGIAEV